MKSLKIILALAVVSSLFAGVSRADEPKPEGQKAKCCAKAEKDGKTCDHGCCAEAAKDAKDGKNCEKCGGKNPKQS